MFLTRGPDQMVISAWPISAIILILTLLITSWRAYSYRYQIFLTCFWIYLTILLDLISFPIYLSGPIVEQRLALGPIVRYNLNPFAVAPSLDNYTLLIIVLNLLITIPLGFCLPCLLSISRKQMLTLAILVGPLFETIQLGGVLLGLADRVIDVQDMLLNSLGVLLGYWLFLLAAQIYLFVLRFWHVKPKAGFFASVEALAYRNLVSELKRST